MNVECPESLRLQIIDVGRRIHDAGLVAATDGNLSVRSSPDVIWITPTGSALGDLDATLPESTLVAIDLHGNILSSGKPSSEYALHLEVYRRRPDVQAVVHAHPPVASAFMFAGQAHQLSEPVIPEVMVSFGRIPMAAYATPSSPEGPEAIRDLIGQHDVLLLERHGSLTVGKDLVDAYRKLEKLEHAARVVMMSLQLGGLIRLSDDELRRLREVAARLGLHK